MTRYQRAGGICLGAVTVLLALLRLSQLSPHRTAKAKPIRNSFPSLADTFEMATLSLLMYHFHRETDDRTVCDTINRQNYTINAQPPDNDIQCHFYYHERNQSGTQIMIASSVRHNYLALVWAGTDDLRTSLTDVDLTTTAFGNQKYAFADQKIRVHSGFNEYVFGNDLFDTVVQLWDEQGRKRPEARLFTTGHSLGASSSILSAIGLSLHYQQKKKPEPRITSINFGCPRTGNSHWQDFVNHNASLENLDIWRFVLGWDLVPRLPKLFYHSGHTVQLSRGSGWTATASSDPENFTALAYYLHGGDWNLSYAGVPFGWDSLPFIWVPGSLFSHACHRYWEYLNDWRSSSTRHQEEAWIHEFVSIDNSTSSDDDSPLVNVDDDFYVDPPDDDLSGRTQTG